MMFFDWISNAIGPDQAVEQLNALQMVLRAFLVFVFLIFAIKLAKSRFMGKNAAFDFVIVIMLGSVVSRAVNGNAPFFPTLAASIAIILLHNGLSWMVCRWEGLARFVEGEAKELARDGRIDWDAMHKHHVTRKDLESAVRQSLNSNDLAQARRILLEPNGKLSVVRKD